MLSIYQYRDRAFARWIYAERQWGEGSPQAIRAREDYVLLQDDACEEARREACGESD